MALSEILSTLGLTGEAEAVAVSDDSLFDATLQNGQWVVAAKRAFSSTEWMKVTIGEVVYDITVTDSSSGTGTQTDPYLVTTWAELQTALNAGGYVKLNDDITAGTGDAALEVPTGKTVTLDLNGHVIDRAANKSGMDGGSVFIVKGALTVTDSKPGATHETEITYRDPITTDKMIVKGGVITGGYTNADGGGVCVGGGTFDLSGGEKRIRVGECQLPEHQSDIQRPCDAGRGGGAGQQRRGRLRIYEPRRKKWGLCGVQ